MNRPVLAAILGLASGAVAVPALAQGNLPPSSPEQTRQGSMAYPAPLHGNPAPAPVPHPAVETGTTTTATPPSAPTGVSAPAVPK